MVMINPHVCGGKKIHEQCGLGTKMTINTDLCNEDPLDIITTSY